MHEAYQLKFDEIHSYDFSKMSRGQIEDEIEDLLILAYALAINECGEMLHKKIEEELDELEDILWLEIDGETFADRINEHLANGTDVKNLAESEFHRVYNSALYSSAVRSGATEKTWITMGDEKVRDTHWPLDNVTVGINDYFYSISGDKALEPGGFETAGENANCRCSLIIR